jgi:hypothetical protein
MQRRHGNSYVQRRLTETRSAQLPAPTRPTLAATHWGDRLVLGYEGVLPGLQRQEGGEATEAPAIEFTNARFTGITSLLTILQGDGQLSSKHNGKAVKAVQQALFDLAYPLPLHQVDGKLGGETYEAIRRFREDQGLSPGTEMDAEALEALDKAAPPPGVAAQKSVDYARLLADDKLTFTVAIGYDENDWHEDATKEMLEFFDTQGFTGDVGPTGLGLFEKDEVFLLGDAQSGFEYKSVKVEIRFVTPSTQNAREEYERGLSQDDITVYSGHARYGTGPDFDPAKSAAENFVIGVGSALHKSGHLKAPPGEDSHWYAGHKKIEKLLEPRKNDLERMEQEGKLDKDKYQVWFFNACSTIHYLDELRDPALAGSKNRSNLDIIGTTAPIYLDAEVKAAKAFILSILNSDTLNQMMSSMQGEVDRWIDDTRAEGANLKKVKNQFFHEGFEDNPS